MTPERSYSSARRRAAAPRSSARRSRETGVAGRPEEYFEALLHSGRPAKARGVLRRASTTSRSSTTWDSGESAGTSSRARRIGAGPPMTATSSGPGGGDDAERRLRREAHVGLLRRLRRAASQRARVPRPAAGRATAGASSPSSSSCAWSGRTRCARPSRSGRRCRRRPGARTTAQPENGSPPYQSFIEQHRPNLRFHYGAIAHLLDQVMRDEAAWDAFFEHTRIKPTLVLYENFASAYEESTLNLLDRLGPRARPTTSS